MKSTFSPGYNAWLSFSLQHATDASLFSLERYTGQIRTLRSFTETDEAEQRLVIVVKDNGNVSLSATATVSIKAVEPKEAFAASDTKSAVQTEEENNVTFYLIITLSSVSALFLLSIIGLIVMQCSKPPDYSPKYSRDSNYADTSGNGTLCHSIQYRSGDKRYMLVGPRMSIGSAIVPGSHANTLMVPDLRNRTSGEHATDASLFSLERYTGQIRTLRSFTETDEAEQRLVIVVKDNGNVSLSATATVSIKAVEPKEAFAASDTKSAVQTEEENNVTFYLIITLSSVSALFLLSIIGLIVMQCSKPPDYSPKYSRDSNYADTSGNGTLCHSIQYRSGDKRYMLVGPRMSIGSAIVPGSHANTLMVPDHRNRTSGEHATDASLFGLERYTGQIRTLRLFTETDEAEQRLVIVVKDNGNVSLSATATVSIKAVEPKEAFAASDTKSAVQTEEENNVTFYLIITLSSVSALFLLSIIGLIVMQCSKPPDYSPKYSRDSNYADTSGNGTLCHSIQYRSGDKRYMLVGPRMSIGSAIVPGSHANTLVLADNHRSWVRDALRAPASCRSRALTGKSAQLVLGNLESFETPHATDASLFGLERYTGQIRTLRSFTETDEAEQRLVIVVKDNGNVSLSATATCSKPPDYSPKYSRDSNYADTSGNGTLCHSIQYRSGDKRYMLVGPRMSIGSAIVPGSHANTLMVPDHRNRTSGEHATDASLFSLERYTGQIRTLRLFTETDEAEQRLVIVVKDNGNVSLSATATHATDASLFGLERYTGQIRTLRLFTETDEAEQRLVIVVKDNGNVSLSATATYYRFDRDAVLQTPDYSPKYSRDSNYADTSGNGTLCHSIQYRSGDKRYMLVGPRMSIGSAIVPGSHANTLMVPDLRNRTSGENKTEMVGFCVVMEMCWFPWRRRLLVVVQDEQGCVVGAMFQKRLPPLLCSYNDL
ncbi:hypothetical protein COCON_G00071610 [Conger conger]|uniref:Cadherin cytoplasmic C-terminal domain-containing protein n=1 Tax=Conger conger TaxID=82655 RepID=A0A9Q1DMZ6_CONCO|nr:hypothetical protein COCON_G00071610 [Conger conger]